MSVHRGLAGLLALAVLATLLGRIGLTMQEEAEGPLAAVWRLYRYFTIWTNTLIGVWAAVVAFRGSVVSARIEGGLLLAIIVVAVVFHVLLAHLNDLTGFEAFLDDMLHTVIPISYCLLWLVFARTAALQYRDLWLWVAYPLGYCVYAWARGAVDGKFPYFFLDPGDQGILGVALYVTGLCAVFALLGAVLIALGRNKGRLGLAA